MEAKCLGAVIVGLQQTQYDDVCSLRIYAKIDDVMELLAKIMKLSVKPLQPYTPTIQKEAVVAMDAKRIVLKVPYDNKGNLCRDGERSKRSTWDLSHGSKVTCTSGPGKGFVGKVVGRNACGHINIQFPCMREGSPDHGKKWVVYTLGLWWLEAASKGSANLLPVVNTNEIDRLIV